MRTSSLRALLLVAAACGGGLASMPGGPKPAWVGAAVVTEYPEADFFVAEGLTTVKAGEMQATQAAADAAARIELMKKIEVSVSSAFSSYQAESHKDGASSSVQAVEELTRETVEEVALEGVEIKARWLDEASSVAYALAVWPKARAKALMQAQVADAEAAARKAEAEGDRQSAGAPGIALKQYLAARGELEKAQRAAVLLRAVTNKPSNVPDLTGVRAKLDRLLAQLEVKAEEGDNQRVQPNSAAPRPLVLRASLAGAPLGGVPVSFELPGGALDAVVVTDPQGLAASRVANVGALAGGEARATAALDWVRLLASGDKRPAWMSSLPAVTASFRMVPKSMASTRLLVKIVEKIEGAEAASLGMVQSAVANSFSSAGFGVQDGAALVARIPVEQLVTLDPKSFQKQARDLADVVIVGEALSAYSSTLSGTVVVHRARLNMRAVDLGSGELLASISLEEKGKPGDGPEKAGKKALDALAQKLGGDFAAKVKQQLGF